MLPSAHTRWHDRRTSSRDVEPALDRAADAQSNCSGAPGSLPTGFDALGVECANPAEMCGQSQSTTAWLDRHVDYPVPEARKRQASRLQ
jgi:hypothetical protein